MKEITSWLFKNPIVTVVWLSFGHAQSNSEKWSKKLKKLKNLKFFRANPELWGCAILGPKMVYLSWTKLFDANHFYFHLPIGPFHFAKFKTNYHSRSRVTRMHHFWAQNGLFATNFFWKKLLISFSSLPTGPFHCAKF